MTAKTITQLTALAAADAASADVLPIVDVSDTTMAATGTTKKITLTDLQSAAVSAGTANGVMYLNGSKVATSGSALTFDGSVLNIAGSVRAQTSLLVYGSGDRLNVFPQVAGSGVQLLATNNANSAYAPLTLDGSATIFNASGSEQMRLTSTGLGIGTSSPSSVLSLHRPQAPITTSWTSARADGSAYTAGGIESSFVTRDGATALGAFVRLLDVNTNPAFPSQIRGGALSFGTVDGMAGQGVSATEKMRIDSSGNLGLGVTPSAWSAAFKSFDFGPTGSLTTNASAVIVGNNFYTNSGGSLIYKASQAASYFQQQSGAHTWYTAPSGTAGQPISFTQAMTLTASGNLYVGLTTGSARIAANQAGNNDVFSATGIGASGAAYVAVAAGTTMTAAYFGTSSGGAGSITCSGTTTTYNTSSDYRLKNITGPVTNSGAYIDALNPVEGTWKADGSTFVGLIAHEVQEVSRTSIATGLKDGEEMQAMDYSSAELIANLIAEVKSLRARVAALEA